MPPTPLAQRPQGEDPTIHDSLHSQAALMTNTVLGGTPVAGTTWNLDPSQGPVDPAVMGRITAAVALHKICYAWLRTARTDPTWDPVAPSPTPPTPPAVPVPPPVPAPTSLAGLVAGL
jgi:hypothetical protein